MMGLATFAMEIDNEIFSMVIFSLSIESGEKISTSTS